MSCGCNSSTTQGIKGLSSNLGDYISVQNEKTKNALSGISDSLSGVAVNFDFTTIILMLGSFGAGWYLTKNKFKKW